MCTQSWGEPMIALKPGATHNIGRPDWLTQVQHKGDRVEIVDHADKSGMPVHIVTRVSKSGKIGTNW